MEEEIGGLPFLKIDHFSNGKISFLAAAADEDSWDEIRDVTYSRFNFAHLRCRLILPIYFFFGKYVYWIYVRTSISDVAAIAMMKKGGKAISRWIRCCRRHDSNFSHFEYFSLTFHLLIYSFCVTKLLNLPHSISSSIKALGQWNSFPVISTPSYFIFFARFLIFFSLDRRVSVYVHHIYVYMEKYWFSSLFTHNVTPFAAATFAFFRLLLISFLLPRDVFCAASIRHKEERDKNKEEKRTVKCSWTWQRRCEIGKTAKLQLFFCSERLKLEIYDHFKSSNFTHLIFLLFNTISQKKKCKFYSSPSMSGSETPLFSINCCIRVGIDSIKLPYFRFDSSLTATILCWIILR